MYYYNFDLENSKKKSGQKAPWLEIYCNSSVSRDLLRMLQSQIWGTKWPHMSLKNGGQEKIIYRAIENSKSFLEM